jgi:uncharacterized protein (TIGR03067 family)
MQTLWVITSLVVLAAAVPVAADDQPVNTPEKEKKLLQGIWKGVSLEGPDGQSLPEIAEMTRVVVEGDRWTVFRGEQKTEYTLAVDPTKAPKTLDLTEEKDGKKVVALCLYEVDGDTLKICRPAPPPRHEPRPAKFASGDGNAVMTLKREKK